MTKTEQADQLFSRQGFWRHIAPAILTHCILYVGIAYISVGRGRDILSFIGIGAIVICFVALVYYLRYSFAAKRHEELKRLFGAEYIQMVESGKIFINTNSVLLLGAPASLAKRYLPYHGL